MPKSGAERQAAYKARRGKPAKLGRPRKYQCGDPGRNGARWHRANNTAICGPCADAERLANRQDYAQRKTNQ